MNVLQSIRKETLSFNITRNFMKSVLVLVVFGRRFANDDVRGELHIHVAASASHFALLPAVMEEVNLARNVSQSHIVRTLKWKRSTVHSHTLKRVSTVAATCRIQKRYHVQRIVSAPIVGESDHHAITRQRIDENTLPLGLSVADTLLRNVRDYIASALDFWVHKEMDWFLGVCSFGDFVTGVWNSGLLFVFNLAPVLLF